jgi:hypothetical protein
MTVWMMILVAVSSDMSQVHAKINLPTEYKYNTEQICKEAADNMAVSVQEKLGSNNFKVFWDCQPITEEEFNKALPPRI